MFEPFSCVTPTPQQQGSQPSRWIQIRRIQFDKVAHDGQKTISLAGLKSSIFSLNGTNKRRAYAVQDLLKIIQMIDSINSTCIINGPPRECEGSHRFVHPLPLLWFRMCQWGFQFRALRSSLDVVASYVRNSTQFLWKLSEFEQASLRLTHVLNGITTGTGQGVTNYPLTVAAMMLPSSSPSSSVRNSRWILTAIELPRASLQQVKGI